MPTAATTCLTARSNTPGGAALWTFTGIENPEFWEKAYDEVPVSKAIRRLARKPGSARTASPYRPTSQGSLPLFNEAKEFIGLDVGTGYLSAE